MRTSACVALVVLAGCDQLWGTYVQPNPQNCVTSGVCKSGTSCNRNTGHCDPSDAGVRTQPAPVCDPCGFCWENPLPQGNDLYRAWARTVNDVWWVGAGGTILHWDGTALTRAVAPITSRLTGVWGSAANDVWAVGELGAVLHWNGTTWSTVAGSGGARLRGVHGTSATNIWMVGDSGTIRKWDGTALSTLASGPPYSLESVWVKSATDVWAVGSAGTIIHYDGTAVAVTASGTATLSDLWSSGGGPLWIVGDGGATLRVDTKGTVTAFPSGVAAGLYRVFGTAANSVWAAGDLGTLIH